MKPLTPKQARFVDEYLIDLNATQAAIRAGYSEKTARAIGVENLSKPAIALAVQTRRSELSERARRSVDDVMADIGRVREDAMRLVEDQRTGEAYMVSHKDALKALELEGKHLGAFQENINLRNPDGSLKPTVITIKSKGKA